MKAQPHVPSTSDVPRALISSSRLLWWALVALLFAAGFGLRLYDLGDAPLDFHPTRQLHSALIARGMYYQTLADVPAWQREMSRQHWQSEGQIEPQVMERLAVIGYRLAGREALWIPRLASALFWLLGAGFVLLLCSEIIGRDGALVALWFFLIWPYGVFASRSFQPDPLLVAAIAASLWAAFRWARAADLAFWPWGLLTGLLAGFALFIKSVAVFFVAPVLVVLALRCGWRAALRSRTVWGIVLLAALPSALYYLDGLVLRGFLAGQFAQRFYPQMWIDPAFYLRWIGEMSRAVPFELVVVAALGTLLVRRPLHRVALLALWAGYLLMGLALPHHIGTHDYYHLPLFLPVALGLGAVAEQVLTHLRGPLALARLAAVTVLLAALLITGYGARNTLKRNDYRQQAAQWQQVGQWIGPEAGSVALVDDYGSALKYWGWVSPAIWPTADDLRWQTENGQGDSFAARFEHIAGGKSFFIVSPLAELERQPDLAAELARYPLFKEGEDLRIYDLRAVDP